MIDHLLMALKIQSSNGPPVDYGIMPTPRVWVHLDVSAVVGIPTSNLSVARVREGFSGLPRLSDTLFIRSDIASELLKRREGEGG
ncbi:hypothetical protein LJR255_005445 [Pararhizobium sp. LjRoot255]|uniref:hypothetical protein n=1 Tax=Pararhizobium sp. LjRoot255 TaxID=3342298 RepID=UPI003ECDEB53